MTAPDKKSIKEEVDLILSADLTSLSIQKENKDFESQLFKAIKDISLVSSDLTLAALIYF